MMTVSELTGKIKRTIETNFPEVQIIGELSNFKPHNSGHWYFSLKDSDAQISCTMWRSYNNFIFFTPQDGMKIIITGKVTVYPPRGTYQVDVRSMVPAGEGDLQIAFEKLKQKLNEEGLFADEHKKPVPEMPERIGVVTAIDGAALQDMIVTAQRRFPLAELVVAPAKVQGTGAAASVADAIRKLNQEPGIDVIIVARGGGSIEDLWAFNEEVVARAIYDSRIPVISGVGHEVDFTIADFTADLRAATPTAAMEAATPDIGEIEKFVSEVQGYLYSTLYKQLEKSKTRLQRVLTYSVIARPKKLVHFHKQAIQYAAYRLHEGMEVFLQSLQYKTDLLAIKIASNDAKKLMKKGFVLVKQHGKFVKRATSLNTKDEFVIEFFDKTLPIRIDEKE